MLEKEKAEEKNAEVAKDATAGDSVLAVSVSAAQINENNRRYWEQPGGELVKND